MLTLLIASIMFSMYIAISIGANDETMSTVAGSRFMTVLNAAIIGGIFNLLGALLMGWKVEETIGKGILTFRVSKFHSLAILSSMSIWLTMASLLGLPVSVTHSVIGSAIGVGILSNGIAGVNWGTILTIVLGMLVSPITGFILSFFLYQIVKSSILKRAKGITSREYVELNFSLLLLSSAILTAFSKGGNDVGNATAFLSNIIGNSMIARIICGIGMLIGLSTLGKRVLIKVGMTVVNLTPTMAFSAQFSTGIITFIATVMGLPLSSSQVLISSIIGVGYARGMKINYKQVVGIIVSWILTLPVSGILAALIVKAYYLLL